jgi:CheY-like chemotaxis protein
MPHSTGYVLFVDDDSDDREILQDYCAEMQLTSRAHFVESGEALFSFLTSRRRTSDLPSLIVLDMNMPGMNGEEVLLLLKRDTLYRHIPVVFYSTGSRTQSRYKELGAEAFFNKPYNYHQIREDLATFFRRINPSSVS